MTLVLGVDGGGSKTRAVVADTRGEVLGVGVSGPSNWEEIGVEAAGKAIESVVTEALTAAGVGPGDLSGSVFGLAGVDWDPDVPRLESVIDPLGLGGPRSIVNDAFLPLRAGTQWPWGVAVIAGTGAVAAGRNPAGELFRTLGLGPFFGDSGSATDVAEDAVRAVSEAFTGKGPPTALTELMCEYAERETVPELLEWISREAGSTPATWAVVTEAAPLVMRAADAGDLVAREILVRAGTGLGESAALVARRLSMEDFEFEVVLAGGMVQSANRLLLDPLEAVVKRVAPAATFVHLDAPEVVGAVLMAMELATNETYGGVRQRLSAGVGRALRAVGASST